MKTSIALAVALALAGEPATAAVVTQYTYSTTCKPSVAHALWGDCSTLENLWRRAQDWAYDGNPLAGSTPDQPSIVLVTSTTIPVLAIFRFYHLTQCTSRGGCFTRPVVTYFLPANTTNLETNALAMANLDRQVTSTRALKIIPIRVPYEKGTAQAHVGVVLEVDKTLKAQGDGTSVLWGLAGYSMPNVRYIDVIDDRSGEQHRIFLGDTVTVEFTDGTTVVVKLVLDGHALIFQVVAGSARKPNGDPYVVVAKPAKPGNPATWIPFGPYIDARLLGPDFSCRFPAGQVCTTSLNVVHCRNYRSYIGPC